MSMEGLMQNKKKLINKIKSKKALVSIIGMGYVGLPLALRFAEMDYEVICIDKDESKIRDLKKGISYINHIENSKIKKNKKLLKPTSDFSLLENADVIIICVPTPLTINREPDISYIDSAIEAILKNFPTEPCLISLESTTYPKTTKEHIVDVLLNHGIKPGKDCFVSYSPEREDPGNKDFSTSSIPKVLGGFSSDCLDVSFELYQSVISKVIKVSSLEVAEMTKLLENIHRSVNIGLVNELKMVCDKMGIDVMEVIDAAATKPFGFVPYYPGPGLGGHCIPIDPFYLSWKAKEYSIDTKFIELAGEINTQMPYWVVNKIIANLNNVGKSISRSKILVLGLAYKKNIEDMRESPSLIIINELYAMGAYIDCNDPFASKKNILDGIKNLYTDFNDIDIESYDAVLLLTDHDEYKKYKKFKNAKLIIDTRGFFNKSMQNLVRA